MEEYSKPSYYAAIDLTGDNIAAVSKEDTVNFYKPEGTVKGYQTKFQSGNTFTPNKVKIICLFF